MNAVTTMLCSLSLLQITRGAFLLVAVTEITL